MSKHTAFASIDHDQLTHVTGGDKKGDPVGPPEPITPETVGCAIGGAAGYEVGGPLTGIAGCILGGSVANVAANAIERDNAGLKPEQKPYNPYGGGSGGVFGNL